MGYCSATHGLLISYYYMCEGMRACVRTRACDNDNQSVDMTIISSQLLDSKYISVLTTMAIVVYRLFMLCCNTFYN